MGTPTMKKIPIATQAMFVWLVLAPLPAIAAEETEALRVAVFDFELIDTSLEGETNGANPAESARLEMLGKDLRSALSATPGVTLADRSELQDPAAGPK